MKKIIIGLSLLYSLTAFAGESFSADVVKYAERGFKVVEVTRGETKVKKIFTTACKARRGNAAISLSDSDKGYLSINGKNCHIVGVERLQEDEVREPRPEPTPKEPERRMIIINNTGVPIYFYNNVK